MSFFDGLGDFLKSPAGMGLLALGTGGAALAAAPAVAGAGALGAAGAGTAGAAGLGATTAGATGLLSAATPAATAAAATGAATGAAPTGLLGTINAGLKEYAPIMSAANVGLSTARNLTGSTQAPIQPSPVMQPSMGGPQALSQLASGQRDQMQTAMAQAEQERMQRRMQRRGY